MDRLSKDKEVPMSKKCSHAIQRKVGLDTVIHPCSVQTDASVSSGDDVATAVKHQEFI